MTANMQENNLLPLHVLDSAIYLETLKFSENNEVTDLIQLNDESLGAYSGLYNQASSPLYIIRKILPAESVDASVYKLIQRIQAQRCLHFIPRIYHIFDRDNDVAIYMEYIQGQTLKKCVSAGMKLWEIRDIFTRLCDALTEIHERLDYVVIHRDINPSNIMISKDWEGNTRLLLIDFGISRIMKLDASKDTTLFGTLGYSPPEQFGFGQTSVRSDIYSAGIVLYYCLCGHLPDALNTSRDFTEIHNCPLLAPMKDKAKSDIVGLVKKACSFSPEHRYENAEIFKRDFIRKTQGWPKLPDEGRDINAISKAKSKTSRERVMGYSGTTLNIIILVISIIFILTVPDTFKNQAERYQNDNYILVGLYVYAMLGFIISSLGMITYKPQLKKLFPAIFNMSTKKICLLFALSALLHFTLGVFVNAWLT